MRHIFQTDPEQETDKKEDNELHLDYPIFALVNTGGSRCRIVDAHSNFPSLQATLTLQLPLEVLSVPQRKERKHQGGLFQSWHSLGQMLGTCLSLATLD